MKKLIFQVCLCLFATLATTRADEKATSVALADTPAAVQKTIASQIGDGKLDDVNRTTEDGETVFEADFTAKTGGDRDITVADDGTLLKVGVTLADVPAPVQKTIAMVHGWKVTGIDKNVADTEISYEVTITKDDSEKNFTVADSGVLLSMETALPETPAAVQATIKAQGGAGKVQSIDQNYDSDGNSFDVEVTTETGGRKAFSVAPDGRILSEEVTLDQVPPSVRQTVTEKIGDGKILSIDKSLFERRGNVLPYEIEGRKGGRTFNFSVGPRGRFLGMDE
jgi:uncharacterized membrane protein YkoI